MLMSCYSHCPSLTFLCTWEAHYHEKKLIHCILHGSDVGRKLRLFYTFTSSYKTTALRVIVAATAAQTQRQFNSIQVYLYSAFHETIFAKQLYRKLSFFNRCIYCRNLIHFTYGKIWLILYILWGFGINSSQVFGHLGLFKGWIQTEACVIHSYHGMLIQKQRNK